MSQRVYHLFQQSIEAKMQVGEDLAPLIENCADRIVQALLEERKIFVCGNGPSSALAQLFAAQLIDRFEKERPSLPAIWLGGNITTYTAIASDTAHDEVYAKPLRALGQTGDLLVVISSSGNAQNLVSAITAARDRNIDVIALIGRDGGEIARQLLLSDFPLCAHINSRSRIHEIHLLVLNCLCDLIDHKLFGIE